MYEQSLATKERVGDVQGVAYTSGNLGLIHLQRGELEKAEELFRYNLKVSQELGDVHSIGMALNALGQVFLARNDNTQAKPLLVQAYLIFAQLGSPNAQAAAQALVQACDGSVDAANAYLAQAQAKMQQNT